MVEALVGKELTRRRHRDHSFGPVFSGRVRPTERPKKPRSSRLRADRHAGLGDLHLAGNLQPIGERLDPGDRPPTSTGGQADDTLEPLGPAPGKIDPRGGVLDQPAEPLDVVETDRAPGDPNQRIARDPPPQRRVQRRQPGGVDLHTPRGTFYAGSNS